MQIQEIIKIQSKGVITIPKNLRKQLGSEENTFARLISEKGRLVMEPVKTLNYSFRSYKSEEIEEFFALDDQESKKLKAEGLL